MAKCTIRIAVMLLTVFCLFGCVPQKPMYEQADADRIAAEGGEIMQAWLAQYLPDGADPAEYDTEVIQKQPEEEYGMHCVRLVILG